MNATDTGGLQGYVHGHDLETGEQLWAANMIPGPGEPGADTWPGDSREYGGAGPWIVGSYDPELNLYFTGTANAYPWNPYTERDGAGAGNMRNEGAAAIVAVDVSTGEVKWRYTAVPGDPWDYDVPQAPMLTTIDGVRTIVQPNKTGFTHYLEAATGKFLQAPAHADRINWAKGYDASGNPIWDVPVPPEGETVEIWPSLLGSVNLSPSALNPNTGMVYLPRPRELHELRARKGSGDQQRPESRRDVRDHGRWFPGCLGARNSLRGRGLAHYRVPRRRRRGHADHLPATSRSSPLRAASSPLRMRPQVK